MSVAYAALLEEVTDGFPPGADTRAQARTIIERMLDGNRPGEPETAPSVSAEEEEVRQNQAAFARLGILKGMQTPGARRR